MLDGSDVVSEIDVLDSLATPEPWAALGATSQGLMSSVWFVKVGNAALPANAVHLQVVYSGLGTNYFLKRPFRRSSCSVAEYAGP